MSSPAFDIMRFVYADIGAEERKGEDAGDDESSPVDVSAVMDAGTDAPNASPDTTQAYTQTRGHEFALSHPIDIPHVTACQRRRNHRYYSASNDADDAWLLSRGFVRRSMPSNWDGYMLIMCTGCQTIWQMDGIEACYMLAGAGQLRCDSCGDRTQ